MHHGYSIGGGAFRSPKMSYCVDVRHSVVLYLPVDGRFSFGLREITLHQYLYKFVWVDTLGVVITSYGMMDHTAPLSTPHWK